MQFSCYASLTSNLKEIELIAQAADAALEKDKDPTAPHVVTTARIQANAMTRAALVLLCGYFEGFLREISEEYFEILNDEKIPIENYPARLFCNVAIDLVANLKAENSASIEKFKSVLKGTQSLIVDKKKFSKTGGNPSVDTIESVFHNLGIPHIIDALSIQDYKIDSTWITETQVNTNTRNGITSALLKKITAPIDDTHDEIIALIEAQWQPRKKRRKVGYVNEIEQLLKKRNRIAHGEGSEQITPLELREHLICIGKLSEGLHALAVVELESLTENKSK